MERLEALETECVRLTGQQTQLDTEVEAHRVRRPDVAEACRLWGCFTELYETTMDSEREKIMQALVVRVEMTENEEGACEVSLLPQVPSYWFELTNQMGAGVGFEPTTFGL